MKPFKYILASFMAISLFAVYATDFVGFYFWKDGKWTHYNVSELILGDDKVSLGDAQISVSDIDSITFTEPETVEEVSADTLYIYYNDAEASVAPEGVGGITVEIDNANVTLTNENTDREMTFILSGESQQGSFTYNGTYKTCIRLDGLNLTSKRGAALDILCGKRVALELAEGTTNYLADAADSLGQKAALYCKGHLEVSKPGTLTVKGNYSHAIKTKEYMLIKKTTGSITIDGAEADGIHAGQYFKMNGGEVSISGVKGDGIQAEATSDGDDDDGQLVVVGGTLDIEVTERDVAGLKSDSLMTITGGTINITTTGDGDKAIKGKDDIIISGGAITLIQSGTYIVENYDPGYVVGIKASGDLDISGGTININNTADAGKGISADGNITTSEDDENLTIEIKANGKGSATDLTRNVDKADNSDEEDEDVYRIAVALSSTNSQYWKQVVYLCSSDGTVLDQLTNTITVSATGQTTRTFFYYDFDEVPDDTYYFKSDDYTRQGGMGGPGQQTGTTYTVRTSGTVSGPTEETPCVYYYINTSATRSGNTYTSTITDYTSRYKDGTVTDTGSTGSSGSFVTATGIKGDGNITLGGGTITITSTGAGAKGVSCDKVLTTTDGTISITNSGAGVGTSSNYTTAKGFTSDGSIELLGGNITIKMTGTGGKGIKSDGTLVVGVSDEEGPTLSVSTTGAKYQSASSAKGIKAVKAITVNGGEMVVSTSTTGAEGLESKLKSDKAIVFNGGKHYFKCYDDCINSAGAIVFDGGIVVCYGTGNDAIDSNYGQSGAIKIGNGAVLSYTTKGAPEEAFDCDNNSYIQITGYGIAISAGAAQGGGGGGWGGGSSSSSIGSAVQGYYLSTSSLSYAANAYYTLADSSGNPLVTYSFPASVSSTLSLFTATGMKSKSSYSIWKVSSKPTDCTAEWYGLYLGSTTQVSTSGSAFTSFTAQ